jgi:glycosyltransferase involved in cell wall biosynthesis
MTRPRRVHILGTRGIPNRHGGFEAFTERLAPWLASRGWEVSVYVQLEPGQARGATTWRGVHLVHVPVRHHGARGSIAFDWTSARQAAAQGDALLTFGFNTAVFFLLHRLAGRPHLVNMDGLEWKRPKWSAPVRAWFLVNSWIAGWTATALVADHPEIARRLAGRPFTAPITVIPYGADALGEVSPAPLRPLELVPGAFALVVARSEPENSILEMVRAWSARSRPFPLLVVGDYTASGSAYQQRVRAAAGPDVRFPGPIYDHTTLHALRRHARLYLHGHTVGGTNPSLVEALGAGSATLAHDNVFNRWVAGDAARYFADEAACAAELDALLADADQCEDLGRRARARHAEAFQWSMVLPRYEALLEQLIQGA